MVEQSQTIIRLLVAESFELVRIGLRSLFENHSAVHLVADTDRMENLAGLVALHKPDVILFDLQLNDGLCIEQIPQLLQICPQSKVLALSQQHSEHTHLQTLRSGAVGIISKHYSADLLLKAIYAIYAGQIWFDRNLTKLLWQAQLDANSTDPQVDTNPAIQLKLSDSERHVAYLACKGLSAKEISVQLFVSEKTVRNQLSVIYKKIGVRKQIELCLKAPQFNYFKESHQPRIFCPQDPDKCPKLKDK